jgi:hypothetical protein
VGINQIENLSDRFSNQSKRGFSKAAFINNHLKHQKKILVYLLRFVGVNQTENLSDRLASKSNYSFQSQPKVIKY